MYDRIMRKEFKTDTQYVEKIYERIRAFTHMESTTKDTIKKSSNILQTGEYFLKYGRHGKPHKKFIYVSDDEESLFWCVMKGDKKSNIKWFKCEDILDIKVGFNST